MGHLYPVNLRISGRSVVVIGGGKVAARKIASLIRAGAAITVISPTLDSHIGTENLRWVRRVYRSGDLAGHDMVIACTDDPDVNHQVAKDAAHGQLVNNVSDPSDSNFSNVAVVERDDVVITVSTDGRSPARAALVKRRIAEWLAGTPCAR